MSAWQRDCKEWSENADNWKINDKKKTQGKGIFDYSTFPGENGNKDYIKRKQGWEKIVSRKTWVLLSFVGNQIEEKK